MFQILIQKYKTELKFFFLAFLPRLLIFLFILFYFGESGFISGPNGDAVEYATLAKNIADHHVFSLDSPPLFSPEHYRTPGYPLFLSIFYFVFGKFWPAVLLQNILSAALVVFVYRLGNKYFGRRPAIIAAFLAALEPNMLYWPNQLVSETLSAFLILFGACCLLKFIESERVELFLFSGLLFALAVYARPINQYIGVLGIAAGGAIFFKKRSIKILGAILLFAVLYAGIIAPWYVRNKKCCGAFALASSEIVSVNRYLNAYSLEKNGKLFWQAYPELTPPELKSPELSSLNLAVKMRKIFAQKFIAEPLPFLRYMSLSFVPFFLGDGWMTMRATFAPNQKLPALEWKGGGLGELFALLKNQAGGGLWFFLGGKIIIGAITIFFFIGLIFSFLRFKENRSALLFLVLIIFYFGLTSGLGGYARFRFPVNPFIFLFAAAGIHSVLEAILTRLTKERLTA